MVPSDGSAAMSTAERITLWVYGLLTAVMKPLLRRKLAKRARQEPGYGEHVEERFGHYSTEPSAGWVWVHAVSLGETRAAAILIEALRQQCPNMRLLLTHGTATGREAGRALLRSGDVQCWLPWDTASATAQFLAHFKPTLGLLMETEVWPQLVQSCRRVNVPLVLVNARLNEKTLRQGLRLRWLSRPAYAGLATVLAQTEADAQRLRTLGASVQAVLGNLKFDQSPAAAQLTQASAWRLVGGAGKPVLLFASSREGEEALWLDALAAMPQETLAAVQWLIVPRHPQRFDEVAQLIAQRGWTLRRKSELGQGLFVKPGSTTEIWLGDSLGDMALYYALSDAALLGGSFMPLGGQNLIEACACGCPVVMGEHTFNFADAAAQAVQAGAALRVANMAQAVLQAHALVSDAVRQRSMREKALQFAQAHKGSAQATAQALQRWLPV